MRHLENPYGTLEGGTWLRGNLHSHTNRTDGQDTLQEIVDAYARLNYDFLMVSDHDLWTGPDDYDRLDSQGLLLLSGNEITANGPHLLHVGARSRIEPTADRQVIFDAVGREGGFVIVNHPNWLADFNECPIEELRRWQGYAGIEIYNGVIGELEGSPYATNKWDMMLSAGRRFWGFANDDTHAMKHIGQGWSMAYVQERSVEAVQEALRLGRFYASTGVVIEEIRVEGETIRIRTQNARRIVALMQDARRFAVADAPEIEVTVPPNARYVRFECWGDGESFAWTQPFFVEE